MWTPPAWLAPLVDLVLPESCAVCDDAVAPLCPRCVDLLLAVTTPPREARPDPPPAGMPFAVTSGEYAGALAAAVHAFKDEDRRDLLGLLAPLLAAALEQALARDEACRSALARRAGPVLVVPAPSRATARRRRGDAPTARLARAAVAGFAPDEVRIADVLRLRGRVRDQATLGAEARFANLAGAARVVRRGPPVGGACCVVVDDVVTTGSTLVESARALRAAGAAHVVAATVCATARHAARS
jgi:predicted amidophosphoribosyltransferase